MEPLSAAGFTALNTRGCVLHGHSCYWLLDWMAGFQQGSAPHVQLLPEKLLFSLLDHFLTDHSVFERSEN